MILVAGEALVDLVLEVDGGVTATLGGAPYNTARACGRLGADVAFLGAISVDRFGTMMAAQLAEDGVSTDLVPRTERPSTLAAAELNERGAATYRFYIDGTSAPALDAVGPIEPDVVFTGGLGLVLEPMAATVEAMVAERADSAFVMIDVNCRPKIVPDRDRYAERVGRVIARADVVKVSDEDLDFLAPGEEPMAAATAMLERGPKAILLTAGGDATRVVTAAGSAEVPVHEVAVVDTIGAGDSFDAGFLAWWVASGLTADDAADLDRLVPAVEAANTVAAVVVGRRGADPPRRDELAADWSP